MSTSLPDMAHWGSPWRPRRVGPWPISCSQGSAPRLSSPSGSTASGARWQPELRRERGAHQRVAGQVRGRAMECPTVRRSLYLSMAEVQGVELTGLGGCAGSAGPRWAGGLYPPIRAQHLDSDVQHRLGALNREVRMPKRGKQREWPC